MAKNQRKDLQYGKEQQWKDTKKSANAVLIVGFCAMAVLVCALMVVIWHAGVEQGRQQEQMQQEAEAMAELPDAGATTSEIAAMETQSTGETSQETLDPAQVEQTEASTQTAPSTEVPTETTQTEPAPAAQEQPVAVPPTEETSVEQEPAQQEPAEQEPEEAPVAEESTEQVSDVFAGDLTSRAYLMTQLYNMAGSSFVPSASPFTDVPLSAPYAPAVIWATEKGLVNGSGGDTFGPDQPVTRETLAAVLKRYAMCLGISLPSDEPMIAFADMDAISSYARSAVETVVKAGIMSGYPDGTFRPNQFVTSEECNKIIYRFISVVGG